MEELDQDIRNSLQDLEVLHALESSDGNCDSSTFTAFFPAASGTAKRDHQVYSLRRSLRLLERTLIRVQEVVDSESGNNDNRKPLYVHQQDNTHDTTTVSNDSHTSPEADSIPVFHCEDSDAHAETTGGSFMLHDTFLQSLLTILTRLKIPIEDDSVSLELSVSILKTAQYLWSSQHGYIPDQAILQHLLRRVIQYGSSSNNSSPQAIANQIGLCQPWLDVLLQQLEADGFPLLVEHQNTNVADREHRTATMQQQLVPINDPHIIVLQLQQLVQTSLQYLQCAPRWDVAVCTDPKQDAPFQWCRLSILVLDQVVQLYRGQEDQSNAFDQHSVASSITEAVQTPHEQQQVASPTDTNEKLQLSFIEWIEEEFMACDASFDDDRQGLSARRARHFATQLLDQLQLFSNELVEYALDALDGTAAEIANLGENEKAILIIHTLRHVETAVWMLQEANAFSPSSAAMRLWKTLATAFVSEKIEDACLPLNHLLLLTAQISLRRYDVDPATDAEQVEEPFPVSTLGMTFLRALEYPASLIGAFQIWSALEKHTPREAELKYLLQTATLSLHSPAFCSLRCSLEDQMQVSEAILRILRLDKDKCDGVVDPWDVFFQNRLVDSSSM